MLTAEDLKQALSSSGRSSTSKDVKESADDGCRGGRRCLVLDIDETLAATNVKWFERCTALFGNLEDHLTLEELIQKYHLAQNNPAWQTEEAQAWMEEQRTSPEAQDELPLIPGALQGVRELQETIDIVAYLTVRPDHVNPNTERWLQQNGFPDLPVIAKPSDVRFEDGNRWKASVLHMLWPHVSGIVDDNPKVAIHAGNSYEGKLFLFGHTSTKQEYEWAIPCNTWHDVVAAVSRHL